MKLNFTQKISGSFDIFKKLLVLFLTLGFLQANAQNTCATAIPITAGSFTVDIVDGTNIITNCSDGSRAEWYSYTPTQNHSVTISSDLMTNVCKDTRFNVYIGSCENLVCYTGDDDSGNITCSTGTTYLSTKTFDVLAGTTYYIAWDDRWSNTGFDFILSEGSFIENPCNTATTVTAGTTTVSAIDGETYMTSCSTAPLAEWFVYVPTQDYKLTVTSDLPSNLCKNTNFSVYTGSCTTFLSCMASDDNSGILTCSPENTESNLSKRTFDVRAGVTYFIVWDNKWSTEGFDFQIIEEVMVVPVTYTTQTISTVNSDYNICVADMNGDGKDDIAGVSPNNLRIHYQGNAGTFTYRDFSIAGQSQMPSWSLAAGDYNKDGFNDLILGSSNGLSFWKSNAVGTAYTSETPGQYIFCQRTNFIDLNNDGNLDAFSCHDVDPNVYYMNNGAGVFTYFQSGITPGAYSLGITPSGGNYASLWSDFDNDGDSDLFISKCSGPPCELHLNNGDGTFSDVSSQAGLDVSVQSWSSAVADFDNDGDMDILIGSNGNTKSMLFRNNHEDSNPNVTAFTNITAGSGWDFDNATNRDYIAYDFDNDGLVDVMGSGNKIMFNRGNGFFEPVLYPSIGVGAVGDLNGDGFLDILNGNTIRYAVPNENNWLTVSLKGVESNSNGIGARIEIYGAWGKQIRDVRSGEGFQFMSTINAHFGIGTATAIDKIVIKWPSGTVDTILNPSINQSLRIVEGSEVLATTQSEGSSFSVYPNPANEVLNIKMGKTMANIKTAQVYDLSGRLVLAPTVSDQAISVKSLSTGTYLLLLKTTDGKQFTQKFLKK